VEGVVDANPQLATHTVSGFPILGDDSLVLKRPPSSVRLVNGIGSTGSTSRRTEVYCRFHDLGYAFVGVVHPAATVALDAVLGEGVQLMAGSVVQAGARIAENVLINTRASVDHDCDIGAHAHVAPGATLSGGVQLGEGVHVGTGATIIQGVRIGAGAIVAAGAVVVTDIPRNVTVAGVPAREVRP
jgi:UDP-perosamine 4-acetyltransferase